MATKKQTQATPATATYTLSPQAQALAATVQAKAVPNTLQQAAPKQGKAWRVTGVTKPNTRALALAALAALPQPFTLAQAQAALAALPAGTLGSGTPRSYCVAFLPKAVHARGNGYLVAAA